MFEDDIQSFQLDAVVPRPKTAGVEREAQAKRPVKTPPAKSEGLTDKFNELKGLVVPVHAGFSGLKPKNRGFWLGKKFWLALLILAAVAALGFGIYQFGALGQKIFAGKSPFSFLSSFGQLFSASDRKLAGEAENGQVNILLLGIGGEGHEGSNLTDTIILASLKPGESKKDTQISLLSIPRDFIAKLPDNLGFRKINSAYAYGEFRQTGLGSVWITEVMEGLSGESLPYYAVIDFAGFRKAIDDLGGIDVNIETAFKDYAYPDYKGGYLPPISFTNGVEHMTGERALQFARSRHGTNGEGSDYARIQRQQLILSATRERVSKIKFSSLSTISRLLGNFADHFKTNMEPFAIKRLYDLVRDIDQNNIISASLDPSTGIVCNAIDDATGAYILSYCPGKTSANLKAFIAERFASGAFFKELPAILIQNSTKVAGLAQKTESVIGRYNMEISTSNFPDPQTYSLTTIYDLTADEKPRTLEYLSDTLGAYVASGAYPYLDKLAEPKPDFVIVLGADAPARIQKLYSEMQSRTPAPEPFESK